MSETRCDAVIEKTGQRPGWTLHDVSAAGTDWPGRGNVLLAGEAGGFNRCGEGITSALLSSRAAGESILRSIEGGRPALAFCRDAVAGEIASCTKVNRRIVEAVGLNPFTRN